ncbi:MAG TPA: hypothetical protein GXX40_10125 [Firmicutes bacterium]|nr:hypothetical protein [Bacillota bacterium]
MIKPYPDAWYCSKVCGSRCCKVADVWTLQGEELSYEFWKANYPRLGKSTCGCLDENGLCIVHDAHRPLICRIFPYFRFEDAVLASLSCKYVSEVILPSINSHIIRDSLFREVLEYIDCECSGDRVRQIEQRLRECKGLFLLIRGNRD